MAQEDVIFGLDILKAVLSDCGESESVTGDYATDAKRFIREVYWDVLSRERWPWALSPTPNVITTVASDAVTVLSISSATPAVVTLSATIAATRANRKFYMEANQSVYRIAAHTAGTALLTLDAGYVETETAGSAVIFQDEYDLPSTVLKVWDPMWPRGWQHDPIKLWDKPLFEQKFGRGAWGYGSGIIEAACEIHPSAYSAGANGIIRKVRFAPWSEDALNIEHDYVPFHNLDFTGTGDGDTPRIPREKRAVLIYGANARLLDLKEDAGRSGSFATLYENVINSMIKQYVPQQHGPMHVQMKHSAALGCN